jgi:hypothetical protein
MNGEKAVLQTRQARGDRAGENGIVMIKGKENGVAISIEEGSETRARERIAAEARDARDDRRPAPRDRGADVPRLMKTENARGKAVRRQAERESLDHALRAPGHEGRREYLDARKLSRRCHRENRQR